MKQSLLRFLEDRARLSLALDDSYRELTDGRPFLAGVLAVGRFVLCYLVIFAAFEVVERLTAGSMIAWIVGMALVLAAVVVETAWSCRWRYRLADRRPSRRWRRRSR